MAMARTLPIALQSRPLEGALVTSKCNPQVFVLSSTSLASLLSLRRKLANSLPVKDCEIFRANSPMCTTMFIEYANEHPGRSVFARVVGSMHLTFIRPCHRVLELSRQPSGAC